MNYYLLEKSSVLKDYYYCGSFVGLSVKPNCKNKTVISVKNMLILDQDLIDDYIKKIIDKKYKKLLMLMYKAVQEGDASDDTGLVLDEIAMLKSMLVSKYKQYMSSKLYKELLSKLIVSEQEFINLYNSVLINYNRFDEETNSRSR